MIAFTAAIALGSGVLFALVPAWRAARPRLMDVLQESGRSATPSRRVRRVSSAMVIAEVALALMLVVGAGLLIRSFARLSAVDPGFRTSGVTALHIALPPARYQGSAPKRQFFDDLVERVRTIPGARAVGAVSVLPMSALGVQFTIPFTIDGLDVASPSERPTAGYRGVLAGYFEAMAIPIVKGRFFDAFDGRDSGPRVAIINETTAEALLRGGRSDRQDDQDADGGRPADRRRRRRRQAGRSPGVGGVRGLRPVLPAHDL